MLDFLFGLTEEQRSLLRHLTIRNKGMYLFKTNGCSQGGLVTWYEVMPLFPGVKLDVLTILDQRYRMQDNREKNDYYPFYFHIEWVLPCGSGRKELRVICSDASVLTWEDDHMAAGHWARRDPQPKTWASILKERDSDSSEANIEIFIARKEYDGKGDVVYNPSKREVSNNSRVLAEARRAREGITEAASREIMMIMRRGAQVVYVEDWSGLSEHDVHRNIKELLEGRSWKDIKERAAELTRRRNQARPLSSWSDLL